MLLTRCLELLAPALHKSALDPLTLDPPETGGGRPVHIDATVGLGGHAEAMLAAHPAVRLVGLDRDPSALQHCAARLRAYADRITLVHANYAELPNVLSRLEIDTVDSMVFDLGVSSMQLDEAARGFAYARDAPLDMRMDPTTGVTAAEIVNTYPAADLARVLRAYGEERFASRIAAAIVRERAKGPISSTARLAELVVTAIPAAARRTGGNPAKRTFQALRIEVNGELAALEAALPAALDALAIGGRIAVLAYQSLEDRMVKRAFAQRARSTSPAGLPVELPEHGPTLRLLTRGAAVPDEAEVRANPRAASARLRAAERIDPLARPGSSAGTRQPAMRQPTARGGTTAPSTTAPSTTTSHTSQGGST